MASNPVERRRPARRAACPRVPAPLHRSPPLHVAIVGNGITGVTAAFRIRRKRPDWRITIISGESDHHYSRPALMYVFMGHMRYEDTKPYEDRSWDEERIDLIRAWVTGIDTENRRLRFEGQRPPLPYDRLLIAVGSQPNKFGWPGQDLDGVQGLYGLQDLESLYHNTRSARRAVIVGGGLIGIEMAEMLHSRGVEPTFLVRETSFWNNVLPEEESQMINRVIREEGLGLVLETNLEAILDDGAGRVRGALTDNGREMECQMVGLTAGVSPNLGVVRDTGIAAGRGVLVDRRFRTDTEGVYAAGDCAEIVTPEGERNLVQQVWYTGRLQGACAADEIVDEGHDYDPGIWFNSAKFLDMEYQVYGRVNEGVPGERNLYWEHASGRKSIRVVVADEGVIGFNLMGIRFRHEVCERWIREKRPVVEVLDRLGEANFDPEFTRRHEPDAARALREQVA